jgi:hypothetical protein
MSSSTALIGTVWYGQLGRERGLLLLSRKGKKPLTELFLTFRFFKFYLPAVIPPAHYIIPSFDA